MSSQSEVNLHFEEAAHYWRDVYTHTDVNAQVYKDRHAAILRLIDDLHLAAGTRILEVGCGAGRMAVDLARKGYQVEAVDSVGAMIGITRELAISSGVEHLVKANVADISGLAYENGAFAAALAVGVTPWVTSLKESLRELARVLRPGGHLVITADNSLALSRLLDPAARITQAGGAVLHAMGLRSRGPIVRMYNPSSFDSALRGAGFDITRGKTIGFGPFTFARQALLPNRAGLRLNDALQKIADNDTPLVRMSGRQYVVLAQKRGNSK